MPEITREISRNASPEDRKAFVAENIERFERKYGKTFERFVEEDIADPSASLEEHEDYAEWSYWIDERKKLDGKRSM
ncbi:MAG: hypothetical protein ACUVXI_18105 [bacterium]